MLPSPTVDGGRKSTKAPLKPISSSDEYDYFTDDQGGETGVLSPQSPISWTSEDDYDTNYKGKFVSHEDMWAMTGDGGNDCRAEFGIGRAV